MHEEDDGDTTINLLKIKEFWRRKAMSSKKFQKKEEKGREERKDKIQYFECKKYKHMKHGALIGKRIKRKKTRQKDLKS